MTLEDQVTSTLHDLAAEVAPRSGLTDVVLRKAHRRRRTLRLATAGGTVVAVTAGAAFVFADPLAGDGAGQRSADPAAGADAGSITPIGTVSVDLGALATGTGPEVEWYSDGELRAGDAAVPYDGVQDALYSIEAVAGGGFAVLAADDELTTVELSLLDASGERTVLGAGGIGGMAASPDGALVAWAQQESDSTTLYVTDVATGDVVHQLTRSGADGDVGIVRGFLGDDRVLLDSATTQAGGVWDLAAGTVGPWGGPAGTSAVSPDGTLAAAWSGGADRDAAALRDADLEAALSGSSTVVDTATGEQLWAADSYAGPRAFSPDSRFVALRSTSGVTVADARTGEELVRFDGIDSAHLAWEPDGSLILEVWPSLTSIAVLRCELDGQCELAAPVAELDAVDGSMPYVVGGVGL